MARRDSRRLPTYKAFRKISKRVDDLLRESAALQENVIPKLASLADVVTAAVDFGIQVRWSRTQGDSEH
jgi:hypothetical protein